MVHLSEPLISHVAVWQELHLNQHFAKIHHKCLWKKNLTDNQMVFLREKLNMWEHKVLPEERTRSFKSLLTNLNRNLMHNKIHTSQMISDILFTLQTPTANERFSQIYSLVFWFMTWGTVIFCYQSFKGTQYFKLHDRKVKATCSSEMLVNFYQTT